MRDPSDIQHDSYGLHAWEGKFRPMAATHRHHELELNYVLRGAVTYLIAGSLVTLPARRLCALWGAVPHRTVRPDDRPPEAIWVTVPLRQVLAWQLPDALVRRLLREGIVVENGEQPGDPALLRQWIDDLHGGASTPSRAMLLEIGARLWRMAARLRRSPPAEKVRVGKEIPAAVERLAGFLAQHYREPVSMADAARAAHVHPHYAMTLFRRHTGLTLHAYLTLQRVAHAQRLLATTEQGILDVALESGFASVSRFYEAFKKQTGVSPRRFRLRLAGQNGIADTESEKNG